MLPDHGQLIRIAEVKDLEPKAAETKINPPAKAAALAQPATKPIDPEGGVAAKPSAPAKVRKAA